VIEQAACVPYRPVEDGYQVLLITTRRGKWTLPKGIVDPGETPEETACKEAFEEAGVRGEIDGDAIGGFTYSKWGEELTAQVYLLKVHETLDRFEEEEFRDRRWLERDEALQVIRNRMRRVLARAIAVLDERYGRNPS